MIQPPEATFFYFLANTNALSLAKAYQNKAHKTAKVESFVISKPISTLDKNLRSSHDSVIPLQRDSDNQAFQTLARSGAALDFASIDIIQPKLKISQPRDVYEQEADRIAEEILGMPISSDPAVPVANVGREQIGRKCATCEMKEREEEKHLNISRKPSAKSNPEASNQVTSEINNVLSNGGSSLDSSTKEFMEPRFGYDFSNVRVHDDIRSKKLASSVNARAFTVGNDIFLGTNESISDKRLMAHELTHVVQQNGAYSSGKQKESSSLFQTLSLIQRDESEEEIPPPPAGARVYVESYGLLSRLCLNDRATNWLVGLLNIGASSAAIVAGIAALASGGTAGTSLTVAAIATIVSGLLWLGGTIVDLANMDGNGVCFPLTPIPSPIPMAR